MSFQATSFRFLHHIIFLHAVEEYSLDQRGRGLLQILGTGEKIAYLNVDIVFLANDICWKQHNHRQLPLLLEEQGRRVTNSSMSIIQISSDSEVDDFYQEDCFFLAEMSQPNGCKKWTKLLIGKDPFAQKLVAGELLPDGHVPYSTLMCVNTLLESGQYALETNLTIASTDSMNIKVCTASPTFRDPLIQNVPLIDFPLQDAVHGPASAGHSSRCHSTSAHGARAAPAA
jgi:hypothetical protein